MDLCSAVHCFQPIISFLAPHADYIIKFNDNLNELKDALSHLESVRGDLERKVIAEERKGPRRKDVVGRWLSKAQTVANDTNLLVAYASPIGERLQSTHGYFSTNLISAYSCGKKMPKKLVEVNNLIDGENFEELTRQATLAGVVEQPTEQTVGLDTILDNAWRLLMEDGTRMLGLYGMGGVGKTTLLTRISNKFKEVKEEFDIVIWVTVSKNVDIGKIQDDIGKRLGLCDDNWCKKDQNEKRGAIFDVLKYKEPKHVLLLDGLWKEVSLTTIGIPLQQGGEYKIVFTTRSKNVSGRMNPNEQKEVECLGEEDALVLLMRNAGIRDGLSGVMLDLAKEIVKKCQGLPLALEIVGKCLSSRTSEDEWRQVLCTFGSDPDVLEGMKNKMFGVLKVSYDDLEGGEKDAQSCFKYCALFPLAYNITQDELVEYWIGEGIIDVSQGRVRAKSLGYEIINTLVGASLLLKDERKLHMHNMIREMALWIAAQVTDGRRFHVQTDAGLTQLPNFDYCSSVTKMSLMNNEIESITDSSSQFPNLVTLFLQNNKLADIVGGFFLAMSTLVVLDLSGNLGIKKLPDDISKLEYLRYLNLSETSINHLGGLKHLILLIHLNLESTYNLRSLSIISGLLKLQVLRLYGSAPLNRSLLERLEKDFHDLHLLTITVREVDALEFFLGSKKLPRCTQGLFLEGLEIPGKSFAELDSLSKLEMTDCKIIETETEWRRNMHSSSTSSTPSNNTWFRNLSAVVLLSCEHLKDVTWLIYAEKLESLSIRVSPKMEEVISQEKARDVCNVEPFLNLRVLVLEYLDELTSIYWTPLSFPRLHTFDITNCPKLPFNSISVRKLDDLITNKKNWRMELKSDPCPVIRTASDSQLHSVM